MSARLRILELRSTYGWGGGPDKTILLSAERHDPQRFEIHLLYLRGARDDRFDLDRRACERGLRYSEIVESGKLGLGTLRAVERYVREHRIDIVHCHEYKSDILIWLLSRRLAGVRCVSTAHGWASRSRRMKLYTRLDLRAMRSFDRVIAVSRATRERLLENGIREPSIVVIPNAIDERAWSRAGTEGGFREEIGVAEHQPLIGSVTRLGSEKDLDTFLLVASAILERRPDARFVLAGDGPEREALVARSRELGLERRIHFLGYRTDLPRIYRGLDLHLITSITEGLPNSLLEAMSMEVPTVSTAVGGIPELIRDGENGFLLPAGEVEGLTLRLRQLLEDPVLRERIARAGRATIEREFSFDGRVRRVERLYEEMADGRS